MIEVSDLHTYRGLNYVLQGVNLSIEQGACTVLLGRNGMGKTTLVHTIMGMLRPRSGRITFGDEELVGKQPFQIARRGIALIPQGRRIFPSLTVEENLTLAVRGSAARGRNAAVRTASDGQGSGGSGNARTASDGQGSGGSEAARGTWTLDRVYDLFGNLAERRRLRGGQLSGGEQQMLAIARALLANPKLLLMDEPSEGLAPVVIERIGEILADLCRGGMSIFLVEQNYGLAIALADTAYILSNGRIVWHGTPAELESSAEVRETYLGV
jgi:branched-chain amino acid transport system ATP-binding protein